MTISRACCGGGGGSGGGAGAGACGNTAGGDGGDRGLGTAAVGEAGNGGVDGAEADVGEDNVGVGDLGLNLGGDTGGGGAFATLSTELAGLVDGEGGVEPEHVDGMVIPDGHDENHVLGEGLAHLLEAALALVVIEIAKDGLLGVAPGIGDGVLVGEAGNGGDRVGDDDAILDVEALDLGEIAGRVLQELGDNGELLCGIDSLALAVEGLVAHAVSVEIASIGIANTAIAVSAVGTTAAIALAPALADGGAGVRSEGGSHVVGLPDIHLRAASTIFARAGVAVILGGVPSLNVGLAVDELDVAGALSITVTGTVLGTSLVAGVLGKTTVEVHGDEVESTVQTAANVGDIDIKGELVAEELEACGGG